MNSAKTELRQCQKSRFRSLTLAEQERQQILLCQNLSTLWDSQARPWVLGFVSLPGEPNLQDFWVEVLQRGRLAFPRVQGDELGFYEVTQWSQLQEVPPWGIREPVQGTWPWPFRDASQSLILIPGLAFDLQGGRLGRGKGFYDRFLSSLSSQVLLWGVGWQESLVDEVPLEGHDKRLHGWVGPGGLSPLAL